jgi:hypothetical protein
MDGSWDTTRVSLLFGTVQFVWYFTRSQNEFLTAGKFLPI